MKIFILGLVGVLILGGGAYYFFNTSNNPSQVPAAMETDTETQTAPQESSQTNSVQNSTEQTQTDTQPSNSSLISIQGRTLSGSAPGFAKIQLRFRTEIDGESAEAVQTAQVDASGKWTLQANPQLPGGTYEITLVAFKTAEPGSQGVILKEGEDGRYTLGN